MLEKIQNHLKQGGTVVVSTYCRAWQFDGPKYAEYFRQDSKGSLYMRRGKSWDCIDYCAIRAYR